MQNIRIRSTLGAAVLLALAMAIPAAAQAQAQAQAQDGAVPPAWEQLTDAQREALVAPLRKRWNDHPGKRARMLEHAERWRQMDPAERERAHRGAERWRRMDPEKREALRALYAHMRSLPEAERDALRKEWSRMSPEQRRAWVKAHPAPPASRQREDRDH